VDQTKRPAEPGSPADIGVKLHQCMEFEPMLIGNGGEYPMAHRTNAIDRSISLGVFNEFASIDVESIVRGLGLFEESHITFKELGLAIVENECNEFDVCIRRERCRKGTLLSGTADLIAIGLDNDGRPYELHVVDYKSGDDDVDVVGNRQLLSLLAMARQYLLTKKERKGVELKVSIVNLKTSRVYTHCIDSGDEDATIEHWGHVAKGLYQEKDLAKERPSVANCRYCPLKANCGAFRKEALSMSDEISKIVNNAKDNGATIKDLVNADPAKWALLSVGLKELHEAVSESLKAKVRDGRIEDRRVKVSLVTRSNTTLDERKAIDVLDAAGYDVTSLGSFSITPETIKASLSEEDATSVLKILKEAGCFKTFKNEYMRITTK